MSERRHPNVINQDEVKPYEMEKGKHKINGRILGTAAGNKQLGGTLYELAPGSLSYPHHFHCANEETVYVISGTGTTRIGNARVSIRAGDWIAYPVGPEHAHQIINDGDVPLVYLCISTLHRCEVVGYPDSKKIGASGGESFEKRWIRQMVREGASLDYWDGEPNA